MTTADAAPKSLPGLDINPAEDGYIVYQPEMDRVHFLNHSATLILELCTGENSPEAIAGMLAEAYGLAQAPIQMVRETIGKLREEKLLESRGE